MATNTITVGDSVTAHFTDTLSVSGVVQRYVPVIDCWILVDGLNVYYVSNYSYLQKVNT